MELDRAIDSFGKKILMHQMVHESFLSMLVRDSCRNYCLTAVFRIIPKSSRNLIANL